MSYKVVCFIRRLGNTTTVHFQLVSLVYFMLLLCSSSSQIQGTIVRETSLWQLSYVKRLNSWKARINITWRLCVGNLAVFSHECTLPSDQHCH